MGKSRKRTPVFTHDGGESQKESKVMCNKRFRRQSRQSLKIGREPPLNLNEVMCTWEMNGMGKFYWHGVPGKYMRK